MKRTNNTFVTNATFVFMNDVADAIVKRFGGEIIAPKNETRAADGHIFTDEDLTLYHTGLYRVRIDFSTERHNAIEVTAKPRSFYVTIGETVAPDIADAFTDYTERVRMSDWELKDKRVYTTDALKNVVQSWDTVTEKSEAKPKKSATKPKKSATAKSAKTA